MDINFFNITIKKLQKLILILKINKKIQIKLENSLG